VRQEQMSHAAASIRLGPAITISWMVRQLLMLSFASAFLQYWTNWTTAQYVPVLILLLAALLVLGSRYRRDRLIHLLSGGALLLTAVGFTEVVSYYSSDNYSVLYGITLITIIIAVRLILQQIGLPEVVYSYFKAGVIITMFLLISGRKTLVSYTAGTRFTGNGAAHVNLLAFVLAGFLPVLIWQMLESHGLWKRRFMVAVSLLNFLLIFLSGSRGSLFAVLVAGLILLFRFVVAGRLQRILRVRHIHLILILIAVPLTVGFLAQHERAAHLGDFFNTALSLNSSQRGLHSGFSGRTQFWQRALRLLGEEDRWFFGFGYRMGDRMVGTIDNGYLQLLFESGFISGGIILGVLLGTFFRLWRATQARENSAWLRYHLTLWSLLIVYLVNNISTRYLFSFGNCFSVCVIFLMCASRRELLGPRAVAVRPAPTSGRSRAIPAFATAGGWSPRNG
jgi:O-antigen ligase